MCVWSSRGRLVLGWLFLGQFYDSCLCAAITLAAVTLIDWAPAVDSANVWKLFWWWIGKSHSQLRRALGRNKNLQTQKFEFGRFLCHGGLRICLGGFSSWLNFGRPKTPPKNSLCLGCVLKLEGKGGPKHKEFTGRGQLHPLEFRCLSWFRVMINHQNSECNTPFDIHCALIDSLTNWTQIFFASLSFWQEKASAEIRVEFFPTKSWVNFAGDSLVEIFSWTKNRRKKSTKNSTAKFKSEFGSFAAKIHTARIWPWRFGFPCFVFKDFLFLLIEVSETASAKTWVHA